MKRFANCLGVLGFVNPPIGKALPFDSLEHGGGALCIFDPKGRAVVPAELKLAQVTLQVLFADGVEPLPS
jgi:hypothetical protein